MNGENIISGGQAAVISWCKGYIARVLNIKPTSIDEHMDFSELGLDSSLAVSLLIEIEQQFGVEVSTEDLFNNPNIASLAALVCPAMKG